MGAERERLLESQRHLKHWERWGPYLAERAWANPREDYSPDGDAWQYFPHDHARSRAYRWTEDGILGICDNHQRLCLAFAFWNGRDPILKERLFGLSGPQGNHGEDVKEYYYYLDSTPTHSYMKGLYKYPQLEYPYAQLVEMSRRRDRSPSMCRRSRRPARTAARSPAVRAASTSSACRESGPTAGVVRRPIRDSAHSRPLRRPIAACPDRRRCTHRGTPAAAAPGSARAPAPPTAARPRRFPPRWALDPTPGAAAPRYAPCGSRRRTGAPGCGSYGRRRQ